MNTARIKQAAIDIEENTKALGWLERYGKDLTGRNADEASVSVHLNFAGACPGAKEAATVLSSFGRIMLPELVEQATRNCRNTIDMAKAAIREETEK